MFHEASGKKKIKMATYLTSWNRKDQKKSTVRTGPGLFKRYMPVRLSLWRKVDPLTCPKCHGQMRIISFIEDEEVTRLPCLSMTCNGYELWEMKRGINLVIGCQGQWRAGKKDTQAPWVVGNKDQTAAQVQCTAKGSRILYRLHGFPASGVR